MTLELEPDRAPGMTPESASRGEVEQALSRAVRELLRRQNPDGSWSGELESNSSITAEYLLLQRYLGLANPDREAAVIKYLRSQQRDDGSYAIAPDVDGDISITAEVLVALRAAGVGANDPQVLQAWRFVEAQGGLRATRLFTRMWLALGGLWPWHEIPAIPPEWILVPGHQLGSIYDLASWARATTVPLTILRSLRTVFPLATPSRDELPLGPHRPSVGAATWKVVDRALRTYGRLPQVGVRQRALARAERWIVEHQEADGSWAGIQPPWVYGLMALRARGYALDHPVMRRGLEALETFGIEDEQGFRLQACVSPVWDTALALWALLDAGLPPEHEALRRAVDWLVAREVTKVGDWAVRRPGAPPGGWPFEFYNDQYPDTDDTAVVLSALTVAGHSRGEPGPAGEAMRRAVAWLQVMQGGDGGYAAFDADNDRGWVEHLPIADFGEMLDRPSPDVTAHVVEAFARLGGADLEPARSRALSWLRQSEEGAGAYYGRWGVNYVYGDAAAATAFAVCGLDEDRERLLRIGEWVRLNQHASGGFGESVLSYHDRAYVGRGEPTPSQTAWALLSLLAAAESGFDLEREGRLASAAESAVTWLLQEQEESGGWTDQHFTGTGFPRAFYLRYHLYATVFPVMALGRALRLAPAGSGLSR
ncbi:MAG TPA: squalene--hopene cyclase [Candidatus Dormibacteraeota bacterium]|nr:squalene--hopene cyclase [Candidatus Dormibacteraeota bacterium]